ncbi:MAG: hypothetical protein HN590_11540, partial [Calditrichaeota bacterium]|nr:hypothetical protein [Calditrichota bacterium]
MSARIAFLSLCLLIFAVAFFNITYAANITLDADVEFQTMEGWGASSNFFEERIGRLPAENRETAFDFVYDDLGTNILCIRLYSD